MVRKLIGVVGLLLLFISCSLDYWVDRYVYTWEIPVQFRTINEALRYVADDVDYVAQFDIHMPDVTWYTSKGDCADKALLLQYILYAEFGYVTDYIVGQYGSDPTWHAWLEDQDGKVIEAIGGYIVAGTYYHGAYRYTMQEALYMVDTWGSVKTWSVYAY